MNSVIAAVVTFNRLELLKEVIAALKIQTYPIQEILVIDNTSTDGTKQWLSEQEGLTTITQPNLGISSGVYTGIKKASEANAEWVWVMDDDSIPSKSALENMVKKFILLPEKIGFAGPKCLWTDGSVHYMNIPNMKSYVLHNAFNKYDQYGVLITEDCSFASMLININAAKVVGLPYKEFFIWGDDQEYSKRISDAGYLGLYCGDSIVTHKTPTNYNVDVYSASVSHIWKHRYGFRNQFFMVKKRKGMAYFIPWLILKVIFTALKILIVRKDHRLKFIGVLFSSAWESFMFNPKIDKL